MNMLGELLEEDNIWTPEPEAVTFNEEIWRSKCSPVLQVD